MNPLGRMTLFGGALAVASSVWATPAVSNVVMSVASSSAGLVEIGYELGGDDAAIVTFDIKKNGVSIGGAFLTNAVGDVNRKVQSGVRKIYWRADQTWGLRDAEGLTAEVNAWALEAPPTFMCVDLKDVPGAVTYYADKTQIPGGIGSNVYKRDKLLMRKITAKGVTYLMGTPTSVASPKRGSNEAPHLVTFGHDYYMGIYEVTRGQYPLLTGKACAACASGGGMNDYLPAGGISYLALFGYVYYPATKDPASVATDYAMGLARSRIGVKFNIPTEAEWEYACRAGTSTVRYDGLETSGWNTGTDANLSKIANYRINGGSNQPKTVGSLTANAWDLYDMLGNVSEWCLDYYGANYSYDEGVVQSDPTGPNSPDTSGYRVIRGGSYAEEYAYQTRTAWRGSNSYSTGGDWPYRGFRLVVAVE